MFIDLHTQVRFSIISWAGLGLMLSTSSDIEANISSLPFLVSWRVIFNIPTSARVSLSLIFVCYYRTKMSELLHICKTFI